MRTAAAADGAERAARAFGEESAARFGVPPPPCAPENAPGWPAFMELAVLCMASGWDPDDYVRKAFDAASAAGRTLSPHDLLSSRAVERYGRSAGQADSSDAGGSGIDVRNRAAEAAREEYDRCQDWVLGREMDGYGERQLLVSASSPLPAWFRVLYPEEVDMEIVRAWGRTAREEFSAMPARMDLAEAVAPGNWKALRRLLWTFPGTEGGL